MARETNNFGLGNMFAKKTPIPESTISKDNNTSIDKDINTSIDKDVNTSSIRKNKGATNQKAKKDVIAFKRTYEIEPDNIEDLDILVKLSNKTQREIINELIREGIDKHRTKINQYKKLFK